MSGVLTYLDALVASHKALSSDAYHAQELPKAEAVRAAVAKLLDGMEAIKRRAAPHPDDDDADRKRNLYHCEAIASAALAACGATP